MRLSLVAVAALCLSSLAAHADNYSIIYTGTPYPSLYTPPSTPAQTVGSFDYNGSTFSNFIVTIGTQQFDFTALANQGFSGANSSNPCSNYSSTFALLSTTGSCNPGLFSQPGTTAGSPDDYVDFVVPDPRYGVTNSVAEVQGPVQAGFVTLTPAKISLIDNSTPAPTAVTPEPSSLALLGTGLLGVLGAARRRFA